MVDDFRGSESWRIFRIMGEFVEGFEELSDIGYAVSIFGSARTKPSDKYYKKAVQVADLLSKNGFAIITGGGGGIIGDAKRHYVVEAAIGAAQTQPVVAHPGQGLRIRVGVRVGGGTSG